MQSSLIDIGVVYKVDRLTRSPADFAKLTEPFDGAAPSFVSVKAFGISQLLRKHAGQLVPDPGHLQVAQTTTARQARTADRGRQHLP